MHEQLDGAINKWLLCAKNNYIRQYMKLTIRTLTDITEIAAVNQFVHAVANAACRTSYSDKQLELLNKHVFGIHIGDGAIEDQTFFVIEDDGKIVATAGWSKRKLKADVEPFLNPAIDPARMRTFFVDPAYRGLGALLLQICENAVIDAGFSAAILFATLNGEAFYAAHGYTKLERRGYGISAPPLEGETLEFSLMSKTTLHNHDLSVTLQKLAAKGLEIADPSARDATRLALV